MEKIIAPSLLAADFMDLKKEIKELEETKAKWLHLDVMDGNFVPNISFGFDIIKQLRAVSNLYFDTHLMIKSPLQYIDNCVDAKVDSITFHIETKDDIQKVIEKIKNNNIAVGIAINPDTSVNSVNDYLGDIDLILVMSVNPGFGGQSYIESVESKIKVLKELKEKNNYSYNIQVDGGINKENAKRATACGANVLVAGSFVFKGNKITNVEELL